jgi:gluconolactonase
MKVPPYLLGVFVAGAACASKGGGVEASVPPSVPDAAVDHAAPLPDEGPPAPDAPATTPPAADAAVSEDAGSPSSPDASTARTLGERVCPPGPFPTPVAGAVQTVCADFAFAYNYNEGPTWVARQKAFFFSNYEHYVGHGGDIIKYTPGGQCEAFIKGVGCNGLAATPDGNLVGACHQTRSVVRFDLTTKQPTTVADSYMGQMLQTPNDLVVHSNGTIYFTNPPFELGGRPPGVDIPIFRIDPAGVVTPVAQGRPANGIGLSPDERVLYVLQGGMWDLDPSGAPSNPRPLFVGGDGMAVDCAGNVYASGAIYTAQGKRLGAYPSGTNLAFGGPDGKTLLVVGGGTRVRTVAMNVPGLP